MPIARPAMVSVSQVELDGMNGYAIAASTSGNSSGTISRGVFGSAAPASMSTLIGAYPG
jgi:hypothetical protein